MDNDIRLCEHDAMCHAMKEFVENFELNYMDSYCDNDMLEDYYHEFKSIIDKIKP